MSQFSEININRSALINTFRDSYFPKEKFHPVLYKILFSKLDFHEYYRKDTTGLKDLNILTSQIIESQ